MLDTCPVDGCDWRLRESDVQFGPERGAGPTLEDAINAVAAGRAKARDAAIRAHLESHDVLDYLRTIRRLEQDLYNAGPTGVRPHVLPCRSVFDTSDQEAYWASQNDRE